jgi:hypothetical protein
MVFVTSSVQWDTASGLETLSLPQAGVSGKASFSTVSRASSVRLALKSRGERYLGLLDLTSSPHSIMQAFVILCLDYSVATHVSVTTA